MAKVRRDFIQEKNGAKFEHTGQYSISTDVLPGNIENFIGIVQMPVGVAGPVQIDGEHAQGSFYVPLATTEGTLVASYSRGMRLLNECGGVKTTVVEGFMQRAPCFLFLTVPAKRESSVNGLSKTSIQLKKFQKRQLRSANSNTFNSGLYLVSVTCVSILQRAMLPAKTW